MLEKIKETAEYIKSRVNELPKTAIILGTGLGELVNHIEISTVIPYSEIPNFPVSTVEGHSGKLIFGKLGNKLIMAMQGRFHFYEGYCMQQVTEGRQLRRETVFCIASFDSVYYAFIQNSKNIDFIQFKELLNSSLFRFCTHSSDASIVKGIFLALTT